MGNLDGDLGEADAAEERLVEEMLSVYRREHPELRQVVFRVGTILGETTRNQITAMFDKPRIIALRGARSPFVFVWDEDELGMSFIINTVNKIQYNLGTH